MFNDMQDEEIIRLLETKWDELLNYDIHVAQSPYNETIRAANFQTWMEASNQGFPVPPEAMFEMSDLPNKERVLGLYQQQQQAAAEEAQATRDMEIQKTLIANQEKMMGQPGVPSGGGMSPGIGPAPGPNLDGGMQ